MSYTNGLDNPELYFQVKLYTGTGSSLANTGVGFQPDLTWIKGRSGAADHGLYDAVRGVTKQIESNTTTAETTEATGLTAFGTDGFTVGALAQLNTSSATYVAWNWLGANTTVSNSDGSITSTVSANTTSGFSIVKWSGNETAGASVGHGLGVAPDLIIKKRTDSSTGVWYTYNKVLGNNKSIYLNLTNAVATSGAWNNQTPTNTVFYNGSSNVENGGTMISYCFASVQGFSKFGSYTGNGSTDGTFVYTGFKPAFVVVKRTDSAGNSWRTFDNKRATFNVVNKFLYLNLSNAEDTDAVIDFLSNGFKFRNTSTDNNASGGTYIYMAFAEAPFVNSNGVPCNAR